MRNMKATLIVSSSIILSILCLNSGHCAVLADNKTVTIMSSGQPYTPPSGSKASAAAMLARCVASGILPQEIAVHFEGKRVYVTSRDENTVSIISLKTGTVLNSITVAKPYGVIFSPEADQAYVVNKDSELLAVIDTGSDRVIDDNL